MWLRQSAQQMYSLLPPDALRYTSTSVLIRMSLGTAALIGLSTVTDHLGNPPSEAPQRSALPAIDCVKGLGAWIGTKPKAGSVCASHAPNPLNEETRDDKTNPAARSVSRAVWVWMVA